MQVLKPTSSSPSHSTSIHDLSAEVQVRVVGLLSFQDKLSLRQANHHWLGLVHSSSAALRRELHVTALKGLVRTLHQDSLFCCGGTVALPHPLRLGFQKSVPNGAERKNVTGLLSFPLCQNEERGEKEEKRRVEEVEGEELAGLMECCSAATFGKGSKEVLDPSYRHALQVSPQHFFTNFHLCAQDILDKVKGILCPKSKKIRAELYKLNIYPTGGHFKAHVDTPRGDGMFGSLVVCLPTAFQGGELVVRHAQSEALFHLSMTSNDEKHRGTEGEEQKGGGGGGKDLGGPRCQVKWAAFYSDCEHEILPVTEGHRITLTYNLYSEHTSPQPEDEEESEEDNVVEEDKADEESEEEESDEDSTEKWNPLTERRYREARKKRATEKERAYREWLNQRTGEPTKTRGGSPIVKRRVSHTDLIRRKLEAILQDPGCFPEGVTLAFHCQHSYSAEQFSQASNLCSLLKGVDALVYDVATSLGLKTSLRCFFCLPLSPWYEPTLCEKAFLVCKTFPESIEFEEFAVGTCDYSRYSSLDFLRSRFRPRLLVDAVPPADPLLEQSKREERYVKGSAEKYNRWYTEEGARERFLHLLQEEAKQKEKLSVLPKKVVQWCTDKPNQAKDLVVAVTAAYGNEPSTKCFYASAMLFVEVPPCSSSSPNARNNLPPHLQ
ncbi:Fe2OG dioxygenase domain-containing protein [Balamuthia mandrillaris]